MSLAGQKLEAQLAEAKAGRAAITPQKDPESGSPALSKTVLRRLWETAIAVQAKWSAVRRRRAALRAAQAAERAQAYAKAVDRVAAEQAEAALEAAYATLDAADDEVFAAERAEEELRPRVGWPSMEDTRSMEYGFAVVEADELTEKLAKARRKQATATAPASLRTLARLQALHRRTVLAIAVRDRLAEAIRTTPDHAAAVNQLEAARAQQATAGRAIARLEKA